MYRAKIFERVEFCYIIGRVKSNYFNNMELGYDNQDHTIDFKGGN